MLHIIANEHFVLMHPTATAIGTFDGLHRGHKQILSDLNRIAREKKLSSCLLSFEPHPRLVLGKPVEILTTLKEKQILLKQTDLNLFIAYPFDLAFSQMQPEIYLREFLLKKIRARHLIVGFDHRFGQSRTGNADFLSNMARAMNFDLSITGAVEDPELGIISSTKIRQLLKEGNVLLARQLLGHRYLIFGQVIKGEQRGQKLGFPTANLSIPAEKLLPKTGVYSGYVTIGNDPETLPAMVNIGHHPTFTPSAQVKVEVHILNNEYLHLYGKKLSLYLDRRIRDEKNFSSPDKLIEQLQTDKQTCLRLLA